jgi:Fur family peroxide stress response transcriptional regulator
MMTCYSSRRSVYKKSIIKNNFMDKIDIETILTENGVKPSIHRIKILEYILYRKNHPTVDTIYRDISNEIPTLSKTTVYNTLKTFQDYNVVQPITIEDNEVRYDASLEKHAHFKCTKCNKIFDIDIDTKVLHLKTINGHLIRESHLYFKGLCESCK